MSSWLTDLALLFGAFLGGTLLALAVGAHNLGTALTFGQIAFAGMLVYVLLQRDWASRPWPPGASSPRGARSTAPSTASSSPTSSATRRSTSRRSPGATR